jgi:hypothetical protein
LTWTLTPTPPPPSFFFAGSSNHYRCMFITHMHAASKGHMDRFRWWADQIQCTASDLSSICTDDISYAEIKNDIMVQYNPQR